MLKDRSGLLQLWSYFGNFLPNARLWTHQNKSLVLETGDKDSSMGIVHDFGKEW